MDHNNIEEAYMKSFEEGDDAESKSSRKRKLRYMVRNEDCRAAGGRCVCLKKFIEFKPGEMEENGVQSDHAFFNGWPEALEGIQEQLAASLFEAVENSDMDTVLQIKKQIGTLEPDWENQGLNILNARRNRNGGEFPLAIAASLDDTEAIQTLVDLGCCLCCQTEKNESALHIAALMGRRNATETLLDLGMNVFCFTKNFNDESLVDLVLIEAMDAIHEDQQQEEMSESYTQNLLDVAGLLIKRGARPSNHILQEALSFIDSMDEDLSMLLQEQQAKVESGYHRAVLMAECLGCPEQAQEEKIDAETEKETEEQQRTVALRVAIPNTDSCTPAMVASPPSSLSPSKRRFPNNHRKISSSTTLLPASAHSPHQEGLTSESSESNLPGLHGRK